MDEFHYDPLQAEIRSSEDSRLDYIIEFGEMALKMAGN